MRSALRILPRQAARATGVLVLVSLILPGAITHSPRAQAASLATWQQFRRTADHSGYNSLETILGKGSVGNAKLQWSFKASEEIQASPTIVAGTLYVGSWSNKFYAFDAVTGIKKWTKTLGDAVESTAAVVNGVVYVGCDDGYLYALNTTTGATLWKTFLEGAVQSSPNVVGNKVYVGSSDTHVYALDITDGDILWSAKTGAPVRSSPAVSANKVYVGSDDKKLYALDASTGAILWTVTTGGFVQSSPAVSGGIVYVGSHDGKLYARDAATGTKKWTAAPTGIGSIRIQASPAVAYNKIYVMIAEYAPIMEGYLYVWDAATGALKWTAEVADYSIISPAVANHLVYVSSTAGGMNAYNADTGGDQLLHFAADVGMESAPVVVNGMIYFGDNSGKLYALGL